MEYGNAELPLLDHGNSVANISHVVESAYIRVSKRRTTGPVPVCALEQKQKPKPINVGRGYYFPLDEVSHIRRMYEK
jgi:hypothetical protein